MTNFTPRAANTLAALAPAQILSITRFGNTTVITCTAIPGRAYRMEYQPTLDAPAWSPLNPSIRASGSIAEFSDTPVPAQQRFYRVVLLQ
jgi:hypothetical protein